MRKIFFLLALILVFSCEQRTTNSQQPVIPIESKFKNLLAKYKNISFDTLHVFSSEKLESDQYKFKGKQLDSVDIILFPKELAEQYTYDNGYFACYKFIIDSNRTGLITRTPSTYEPSSVKLLIFDKLQDKISDNIELAETFGDAGDMAEKSSWLFKANDKKYKCFTWVEESHDNSVDDEKDTTVQKWNNYYLLDISKSKVDTVNKAEKELLKDFGSLIAKHINH